MSDAIAVIDTDSHLQEPPDLWSRRITGRWRAAAPVVVWDEKSQMYCWRVGDILSKNYLVTAMAGWREPFPSYPPSLDDADPGSFDADARLKRMDEYGVWAQVLYPNLLTFDPAAVMALDRGLSLECVRVYNDYLIEFVSRDPSRLIPLMMLPFWDIDASVKEIERCQELGHRGIVLGAHFEQVHLPNLWDEYWYAVLATAQERELSINFHIGFNAFGIDLKSDRSAADTLTPDNLIRQGSPGLMKNGFAISDVIITGLCERFPRLKFVSVESGFGYLPFLLDSLDWHWSNMGGSKLHPTRTLPSETFFQHFYATFWFEKIHADQLARFQDVMMFETDYPHPLSLSPGPASSSLLPSQVIAQNLAEVDVKVRAKVLHDNAAHLYGIH